MDERKWNCTYGQRVVKYSINIPLKVYEEITRRCRERRIHRSVWFRDAIDWALNTPRTTRELIAYEVDRSWSRLEKVSVPEKVITSSARTSRPCHGFHKYPGFLAGLQNNSFYKNLFRRELDE